MPYNSFEPVFPNLILPQSFDKKKNPKAHHYIKYRLTKLHKHALLHIKWHIKTKYYIKRIRLLTFNVKLELRSGRTTIRSA